ncbi:SDR family oxidoreductase [Vibrio sp. SS-MA-C1-2]|uniref:DUF2867 domain-containing protein n=1 Tax=Vibrio sp. SS-MA-C1-2 TaxID=2908646 RepID=UPI001F1A0418|nr:DUF2867 domain-containing protein [Vibrio sp. SS-MA-C1-2]UJF20060.1 SDR family oxidoreductase [Vibrio sp. SS-MA-C1-2]
MSRILVIGASGYIGSHLVKELAADGHQIIATGRNLSTLQSRDWTEYGDVTTLYLDLSEPEQLHTVLPNIDIIFFLVHGMSHGHDFVNYETGIVREFKQVVEQYKQIEKIIYLSALQPTGEEEQSSPHLVARKLTGDILRSTNIPVIELRAGIVIGSGSAAFEVMCDFVYHLPVMITPKWISSVSPPIALDNLLFYFKEIIKDPYQEHKIYDLSGPESISYADQIRRLGRVLNIPVHLFPLPIIPISFSTYWMKFITSVPTSIANALISGLKHDLYADSQPIRQKYPQQLLTYEDAVKKALSYSDEQIKSEIWGFDPDALSRWHPNYGYYPKDAGFTLKTEISAEKLWQQVLKIGGKEGYFFANSLWRIREWMDAVIGGKALIRTPPREDDLKAGDYVDSWKVITIKEQQFLSLLFGMKAPGLGRLEFSIKDCGDYRELDIRAWWHPKGFSGLLYWFAMMPAHLFIFKGMTKALANRASKH